MKEIIDEMNKQAKSDAEWMTTMPLADKQALLRVARAANEFCVILEQWARAYPTDVFPEPPHGEHGKTVDACSAAMGRHVTKKLLEDFGDTQEALQALPEGLLNDQ